MKSIFFLLISLMATFKLFSQQFQSAIFQYFQYPCENNVPWIEVFTEDFDTPTIDDEKWMKGTTWGYGEGGSLEDPNNLEIVGGALRIWAKKLPSPLTKQVHFNGSFYPKTFKYSAATLYTHQKSSWAYGKFESKIKIPGAYGLWPAFWLFNDKPEWNEIDIFEFWTHNHQEFCPTGCDNPFNKNSVKNKNEKDQPRIHHMSVHKDINGDGKSEFDHAKYKNPDYSSKFYTFSIEWSPYKIVWKVDGHTKRIYYRYYNINGVGLDCENLYIGMHVIENKIFPTENLYLFVSNAVQHSYYHPQEENFNTYFMPNTWNPDKDEWHPELQPDEAPGGSDLPKYMLVDWVKIYKKDYCGKDIFVNNKSYDDYEHEYLGGKNITFASLGNVVLEPNTRIHAKAQERIYLKPGFHAKAGSYFHARIDPYCGNLRILENIEDEDNNEVSTESTSIVSSVDIFISPNPSTGIFTIESEETINAQQVEVYDVFGKRIQPLIFQNSNTITLNLANNSKGIYLIRIGSYKQKIVLE